MEARRVKRTGSMQVGGSRMRTSVGGGLLGAGGGRGSMNGGRMGGPVGGGIAGGPSLSIVNPLDVLRQRLLLEIARRRMRQSEDQILANRELLKSIGKREATSKTKYNTKRIDVFKMKEGDIYVIEFVADPHRQMGRPT
ncbi:hypothetical protein J437_LFUL008714 [Ladona fulva]|uniref:Corticotropin-releasing factor domain-containing protein n=1 Tax=Ladona fulva TaxID=123851 RepID=A0A8K0K4P7_LADFU|nr:hypothetical protein J437_LFUL008714 [Ladona fulva]